LKTAVILAGGKGTRLKPLSLSRPKPLFPLCNRPIIDYIIELVKRNGFDRLIVIVRYLGDMIRSFLNENNINAIIPNIDPLDTADAIRKISNLLSGNFLVTMGDVLAEVNLREFYNYHLLKKGIATIALRPVENPLEYGLVILDKNSRIVLFLEKPITQEIYFASIAFLSPNYLSHENLVNTGFYMFNEEILDIVVEKKFLMDWGKHVFPYLLENGYSIYGWIFRGYWIDIGRHLSYLKAHWDLMSGKVNMFKFPGTYENGIWFQGSVKIGENVQLKPPVVLGDNVVIQDNATIGPYTVIGNNVEIGFNSVIEKSVIWEDVDVLSESEVVESIVANNVTIGRYSKVKKAVIGAYSLVEENVKILENVKIGLKRKSVKVLSLDKI